MPEIDRSSLRLPKEKEYMEDNRPNIIRRPRPDPGPLQDKLLEFIKDNKARWAALPQAKQAALIQKELAQAGFDEATLAAAGFDAAALIQQGLSK